MKTSYAGLKASVGGDAHVRGLGATAIEDGLGIANVVCLAHFVGTPIPAMVADGQLCLMLTLPGDRFIWNSLHLARVLPNFIHKKFTFLRKMDPNTLTKLYNILNGTSPTNTLKGGSKKQTFKISSSDPY